MNLLELTAWVRTDAKNSGCRARRIPFSRSLEWSYAGDEIRHRSGRFFKIIAVAWEHRGKTKRQLLLDQWEIGILGFVLHRGKTQNSILVQSKVEPGNVGLAQIAPTCQATLSNIDRVHGGDRPKFTNLFTYGADDILSSSLQSEQGTRFFGKRNNNLVVVAKRKLTAPTSFKWVEARLLCQALAKNYLVNTDARSVLVTADWQALVGGKIFVKQNKFTAELNRSYFSPEELIGLDEVAGRLNDRAAALAAAKIIPISELKNLRADNWAIGSDGAGGFKLIHIRVNTNHREIKQWDQPILQSNRSGSYYLYCGRRRGTLFFSFELWEEPGLYNRVELGPSRTKKRGQVIKSCWQSDEGGRFFRDRSQYSLVDIGQIKKPKSEAIWLSLKQVQELSGREGIFCNEARSAISLILSMV